MTEEKPEIELVTIDENHTWKDEVEVLMKRNAHLEQEAQASQLLAAFAILKNGDFELTKEEISRGLPGYQLDIQEDPVRETMTVSVTRE